MKLVDVCRHDVAQESSEFYQKRLRSNRENRKMSYVSSLNSLAYLSGELALQALYVNLPIFRLVVVMIRTPKLDV